MFDRIAGHDPVTLAAGPTLIDEDLAGLDADAQAQLRVAFAPQLAGQLDHRGLHLQRGPDGALGVVLVDGRDPEDGQHRVAGELLDQALVARDLGAQAIERARHQRLHELRVGGLVEAGEADQVGEDHGRDLALPARIRRGGRRGPGPEAPASVDDGVDPAPVGAPAPGAGVPQAGQKRASPGRAVPHEAQARSVGVPQAGQKRVPGSRARPQAWQFTVAS